MKTIKVNDEEFDFDDDRIEPSIYVDEDIAELYGDIDHQDGNYYRGYEKRHYESIDCNDLDYELYTRKKHAVLYYHKHKELLNFPKYKAAYNAIRNEMVRDSRYGINHEVIIGEITDEDREVLTLALDIGILECGEQAVDTYKSDAEYIANRVADGLSISV